MTEYRGSLDGTGLRIAVVSAEFSDKAPDAFPRLRASCFDRLTELGATYDVWYVPGSFEIPTLAAKLASSHTYDAIITLGIVVRGETAHFDYVAGEAARGIATIGRETGMPVIFGVLTTDTTAQADARAHLGADYAEGAVRMAQVLKRAGKI